jgi:hypothetical protein
MVVVAVGSAVGVSVGGTVALGVDEVFTVGIMTATAAMTLSLSY